MKKWASEITESLWFVSYRYASARRGVAFSESVDGQFVIFLTGT